MAQRKAAPKTPISLRLTIQDVLFREGDSGHHMYFLLDGVVDMESRDGMTVYATRRPGVSRPATRRTLDLSRPDPGD